MAGEIIGTPSLTSLTSLCCGVAVMICLTLRACHFFLLCSIRKLQICPLSHHIGPAPPPELGNMPAKGAKAAAAALGVFLTVNLVAKMRTNPCRELCKKEHDARIKRGNNGQGSMPEKIMLKSLLGADAILGIHFQAPGH